MASIVQGMVVTGKKPIVLSPGKDSEHRQAMMRLLIEVKAAEPRRLHQMLFSLSHKWIPNVLCVWSHRMPLCGWKIASEVGGAQATCIVPSVNDTNISGYMAGNVTDGHTHHLKSYHIRSPGAFATNAEGH